MIFKRLFKSKTKVLPIQQDQDTLIRIACGNEDTALRRDACRRINRLPELRELAEADVDAGVREIAFAHYRKLLCGQDESAPPVEERLSEIATTNDQTIIQHVAANAHEPEVRHAAIARLSSPAVIASRALNDPLSANRSAAVELLTDKESLEQVVKRIGKRDKKVYRIARSKLKDIAEREALPERIRILCSELCEKIERLGRFDNWVQDRGMLDLLDRQWAEIEPNADAEWRGRYKGLRERFLAGYEAYRREHEAQVAAEEARGALRDERRTLLDELDACETLDDESMLGRSLERIAYRWGELESLPQKEQASLERKYADSLAHVTHRREKLAACRERNVRLRKLVKSCKKALEQTAPLERKRIRSLLDDAESLLDAPGADKTVAEGFSLLREKLQARLDKQNMHAEQRLAELPAKLDQLAAALDAGELKHAEPLYQSAVAGLDLVHANGLSRKACDEAAERLHKLVPRLRELQKWRRWGSDQHREELCLSMEELARAEIPLDAMALRLHDLQMEWKNLDKAGSPVNHPLWDRFHALSEQVYARCKPHLEAQAAEREVNRRQREELCGQLEDFLDKVDWERMDWKKAMRAEREMRQTWAACGPTEGRHRKALEKRFHTAIKRLDQHLSEERSRNQKHKRDLIERVEALIEETDLERAMEETKHLQREWHTTVAARQKDENKLWQRFRAACDAVFARRRERQDAFLAELEQNLKQRQSICEEAERLALADLEPNEINRAIRDLESRWRDTDALPVPRQSTGKIAQRWRDAHERIHEHQRERRDAQRRESMDLLARQAALCERLEQALETGTYTETEKDNVEEQWQSLPRQPDGSLQAAIEKRYHSAVDALTLSQAPLNDFAERLAANCAHRAELCLRLEILAQVDSPPELIKDRLEFQVNRLKEHMREGEKDPLEDAARLVEEWYLCGSAPASEATALEERFQRVRTALGKAGREDVAA